MNFANFYKTGQIEGADVRFIGINTSDGFRLCRDGIPDERDLKRTYIIKGAAGTGKSTLMKNVAEHFENGGTPVVRFLCSSDPDSLDAVLLDGKILLSDGTAPHVKDAEYPGALSELVCLGNFWNKEKLSKCSTRIVAVSEKKGHCFRKAYRYMSGMGQLSLEMFDDAAKAFDFPKARKTITRFVRNYSKAEGKPSSSEMINKAFGMKGAVRISTLELRSEKVITVSDYYGTGRVFLSLLAEELRSSGVNYLYSPDPLFNCQLSDIYVPGEGVLFSIDKTEKADQILNMERFVGKVRLGEVRGEIRLEYKCWDALRQDAEKELRSAAKYHFELESIYGSAMNFDAVSAYQKLLIKDIENRL